MSKHPPLPETSRSDDCYSSDAAHAVGYGRPPTHTRFKPGQSGNPKGRRKGQRNVRTVVEETLNQRITIREGDRTRSLTKLELTMLTMVTAAAKGNSKAQALLIGLLRSLGMTGETPEAPNYESVTSNDDAVIADYLRRQLATEATDGNQQSAPIETTPPSRKTES
jgi:Family of unknown function (DUF5681)